MISHYPCDLYDSILKNWNRFDFKSTTRRGLATDSIYYNYDLDGHLHDYSYIGANFRERESLQPAEEKFNKETGRHGTSTAVRFARRDRTAIQWKKVN